MSKKRVDPPPLEPHQFQSLREIDQAIARLERRVTDLEQLNVGEAVRNNSGADDVVSTNIRNTILEVFGVNSPEYRQHQHLRLWTGPLSFNMGPGEIAHSTERGRIRALGIVRGLIASLKEKREEFARGATASPSTYFDHLNLHPRIVDVARDLLLDGYHWEGVFAAAKALVTSRWAEVIPAARAIVEGCPSACSTACIDCLYTFRNAFYHQHLDRNTAAERLRTWGDALAFAHDTPPRLPSTDAGGLPVNEAEATLRALLERAGFPPPIGQRTLDLGRPLGSTTPDFFYEDPAGRAEGICLYLDGMSRHTHGNAATQRQDREIREELRHRGYEVFEIPFGHLSDRDAMVRHFYRLGRILLGKDPAGRLRDEPSWFAGS